MFSDFFVLKLKRRRMACWRLVRWPRALNIERLLPRKLPKGLDGSIRSCLSAFANFKLQFLEDPSRTSLHALGQDLVPFSVFSVVSVVVQG